jgi:uncharacterized membrane protein
MVQIAKSNDVRKCNCTRISQKSAICAIIFVLVVAGMEVRGLMVRSNFIQSSLGSSKYAPKIKSIRPHETFLETRSNFYTVASMTSTAEGVVDAAVLKQLDDEIKSAADRKKKLEDQLNETKTKIEQEKAKIEDIATKKKMYLEGAKLGVIPAERTFTETAIRSAAKAMLWRIIAGYVTFATALQFSKSLSTALSIVGSDFFSKSFTMFIGERLMNKSRIGRKGGADNVGRSLMKALLWRLFAVTNTLFAAIFISKDLSIASKIAGSDAIIKTTLMFLYERVWAKVEWGKEYAIDFTI